jgi:hypothetical protein
MKFPADKKTEPGQRPFARSLVEVAPERCVYGSDCGGASLAIWAAFHGAAILSRAST